MASSPTWVAKATRSPRTGMRGEGNTFLLIEQNAQVLDISDRTFVFKTGNNDISGPSAELRQSHDLVRSYLGT